MKEQRWLVRAKETYQFHRTRVLGDEDWTLTMTSKALRRSLGSVCEDITIAKALKKHEEQIMKFDYAVDALRWIRKKQKEDDLAEIE